MKAVIVGIDPGINTGMAVLDMHGNLLHLSSSRNIGRSEVIRNITKFGRPLIVAVDVVPAPKNVERIASSVGSLLSLSERSMSIKEKNNIVKKFRKRYKKEHGIELKIEDKHERDALAASVKAYKSNNYLLHKLDSTLAGRGLEEIFDDVVEVLLKRQSVNISNAINEVLRRKLVEKSKLKTYARQKNR